MQTNLREIPNCGSNNTMQLIKLLNDQYNVRTHNYHPELEQKYMLKFIEDIARCPPNNFTFDTLAEYKKRSELAQVFANLPVGEVAKNFGNDAVLFTWLNYMLVPRKDKLLEAYVKLTGQNKELLEKARLSRWRVYWDQDMHNIVLSNKLLNRIKDYSMDQDQLESILTVNAKGNSISASKSKEYTLVGAMPRRTYEQGTDARWDLKKEQAIHGKIYEIYLDTPFGYVLLHKGIPNAVVGFDFPDKKTLIIKQIQGIVGKSSNPEGFYVKSKGARGLAPLDWEKLMIDSAETLAKEFKFETLAIQGGSNNAWTKPKNKEPAHITLEKAIKRYDDTAKRLGFGMNSDRNWYKRIKY